jgi:endonuclease-3
LNSTLKILDRLKTKYKSPKIELNHSSPFELLIATILSAQCTDKRVNSVTSSLFKKYNKPEHFVSLPVEKLEELIKSTGFYKNKAKNIIACSSEIIKKFNGILPENVEQLSSLPGVGRKTANVILVECFGKPAVVVDTHVKRFSLRAGFTRQTNPVKIEFELMNILPEKEWIFFSKAAVLHGRYVCKSRKPLCEECIANDICPKLF